MSDILESFKNKYHNICANEIPNPGVSLGLINWLETREFPRERFMANDPLIGQKLLIREGIEMVLNRLRTEYDRQERRVADARESSNFSTLA